VFRVDATAGGSEGAAQALGRSRGCSPDPFDSLLPWLLLSVLRAAGRVDPGGDDAFAAVTMDAAAQLQLLGEPYWAVYVALHLPVRFWAGAWSPRAPHSVPLQASA